MTFLKCVVFLSVVMTTFSLDQQNSQQSLESIVLKLQRELKQQKSVQSELEKRVDIQYEKIKELESAIHKVENSTSEHATQSSRDDIVKMVQSRGVAKRAFSMSRPVAFSTLLKHTIYDIPRGSVVNFDNITVNDGGAYRDGIFYVPQSGLYFFAWNFIAENGHSATLGLHLNGMIERYSYSDSTQRPIMAGNNAILRLNPGDRVWMATYLDSAAIHQALSSFSGFWIAD